MKPIAFTATAFAALALAATAAQAQTAPSWTGGYIGGHAGYGFQRSNDQESILFDKDLNGTFNDTVTTTTGANAFSPGFCGGRARGPTPASGCDKDDDGLDLGLRAGYDWQTSGGWVFGGVAEIATVNANDGGAAFSTTPASYTFRRELNWTAAARLRFGYGTDRVLPYVTGGIAYSDIDHTFSTTNTANTFVARKDDKAWGYQFGGGVEARVMPKVTLGLEYLYTSVKDKDYTVRAQGPVAATNPFILTNAQGTDMRRSDQRFNYHAVRLTAAYRF
jgi:outer membrane immunogenic protein